jgi:hypothetical protein
MSGHRRGCFPARDRIVSQAMMGEGAFGPLKAGRTGPENAKQAEMPVAGLSKILCTAGWLGRDIRRQPGRRIYGCVDEISAGHG